MARWTFLTDKWLCLLVTGNQNVKSLESSLAGRQHGAYRYGCCVRHLVRLDVVTELFVREHLYVPPGGSNSVPRAIHVPSVVRTCGPPGTSPLIKRLQAVLEYGEIFQCSGGSKGGTRDAPPSRVQILSISCSFWENFAKSYVGAPLPGSWRPHLGEILDPLLQWALQKRPKWNGTMETHSSRP